jgi:transcriptional regulator with XRE-family HTH domain
LSQETLAERAGLHRNYVGYVERAERNVTIDVLDRLCIALELDPVDLLALQEKPARRGS